MNLGYQKIKMKITYIEIDNICYRYYYDISKKIIAETKENGGKELPGKPVFKLYDTYGFPLELTKKNCAIDSDCHSTQL